MSGTDVVFIVGTGRSGTSALTRTLSLCGADLPKSLYGANEANPRGFWEPVDAVLMNDDFLMRHGSVPWTDTRMHTWSDDLVPQSDRVAFVTKIGAFLTACPIASTLVIKDPRITRLLDFWIDASLLEGLSPKVVIAMRHPREFLSSSGVSGPEAAVAWGASTYLSDNLMAERHSRSVPRVVVDFPLLLLNWRSEVTRISHALSLNLPPCNGSAVDKFLSSDLRRHKCSDLTSEQDTYAWSLQAYAILAAAAQGGQIDMVGLDRICNAYKVSDSYRESDRACRPEWEGARERIAVGSLQQEIQQGYPPALKPDVSFDKVAPIS
jgi:hypothetical protein